MRREKFCRLILRSLPSEKETSGGKDRVERIGSETASLCTHQRYLQLSNLDPAAKLLIR